MEKLGVHIKVNTITWPIISVRLCMILNRISDWWVADRGSNISKNKCGCIHYCNPSIRKLIQSKFPSSDKNGTTSKAVHTICISNSTHFLFPCNGSFAMPITIIRNIENGKASKMDWILWNRADKIASTPSIPWLYLFGSLICRRTELALANRLWL